VREKRKCPPMPEKNIQFVRGGSAPSRAITDSLNDGEEKASSSASGGREVMQEE